MISDKFETKLIELNIRISPKPCLNNKKFRDILIEGELQLTVDKLFSSKNKQNIKNQFIEI